MVDDSGMFLGAPADDPREPCALARSVKDTEAAEDDRNHFHCATTIICWRGLTANAHCSQRTHAHASRALHRCSCVLPHRCNLPSQWHASGPGRVHRPPPEKHTQGEHHCDQALNLGLFHYFLSLNEQYFSPLPTSFPLNTRHISHTFHARFPTRHSKKLNL